MVWESAIVSAVIAIAEAVMADKLQQGLETATDFALSTVSQGLSASVRNLITRPTKQYVEKYINRHGILKVLGMREPINLDDVYTNVRLLNEYTIRDFISTDALETAFRESSQRRLQGKNCETWVGVEVASEQQFLMVLGQPGAGKSTFLRKLGLEALKGKAGDYQHQCIPVFLELKRFDNNEIGIQQRIVAEFETCGFPEPEKFTAKVLEQGKLLVLFDGLDEVPSQQVNGVIDQIQDFVDRYDQNRFIASCRTAAYRSGFRRFKDVVMADFDDAQIQQYIENWFSSEPDQEAETAKHCWELLQQPNQQGAKELAQTPLLLTFLCLVYDRSQSFSSNRSALYRKALRILLEEWAAEKRINRKVYEGLHTELEEVLLSEIAYNNFIEDKLFFEKPDLVDQIRDFLKSNLNADQTLDAESVLDAIAVQQGIFVERAEDVYSFSHLTLQEYLTAQYIVDADCIDAIVEQHLLDKTWQEVFLLVASAMRGKGADRFLLKIIEQISKLLGQPVCQEKLVPILLWAEAETKDAGGNLSPLARRSVANAIAEIYTNAQTDISTIARIYANIIAEIYIDANMNSNKKSNTGSIYITKQSIEYLIELYQDLDTKEPIFSNLDISNFIEDLRRKKSQFPNNETSRNARLVFANQLELMVYKAHYFPVRLAKLSREELDSIDSYYYATYLLIQCKEAAVRVSPETWAAIEERMLRVPEHLRGEVTSNE